MSKLLSVPEVAGIIATVWLCAYGLKCFCVNWLEPRLLKLAAWAGKTYRGERP